MSGCIDLPSADEGFARLSGLIGFSGLITAAVSPSFWGVGAAPGRLFCSHRSHQSLSLPIAFVLTLLAQCLQEPLQHRIGHTPALAACDGISQEEALRIQEGSLPSSSH